MRELGLEAVPLVGIVKPPLRHNEVAYLLVKGREDEPVYLDPHSLILRLLQMIRDENTSLRRNLSPKAARVAGLYFGTNSDSRCWRKRKGRLLRHFARFRG